MQHHFGIGHTQHSVYTIAILKAINMIEGKEQTLRKQFKLIVLLSFLSLIMFAQENPQNTGLSEPQAIITLPVTKGEIHIEYKFYNY